MYVNTMNISLYVKTLLFFTLKAYIVWLRNMSFKKAIHEKGEWGNADE